LPTIACKAADQAIAVMFNFNERSTATVAATWHEAWSTLRGTVQIES
jgi:hypothetical protein